MQTFQLNSHQRHKRGHGMLAKSFKWKVCADLIDDRFAQTIKYKKLDIFYSRHETIFNSHITLQNCAH